MLPGASHKIFIFEYSEDRLSKDFILFKILNNLFFIISCQPTYKLSDLMTLIDKASECLITDELWMSFVIYFQQILIVIFLGIFLPFLRFLFLLFNTCSKKIISDIFLDL
jgi:hypothetical protein